LIAILTLTGLIKDLSGLASLIFLIIFLIVCISNFQLRSITGSTPILIIAPILLCIYFMFYVTLEVWIRFIILLVGIVIFNIVIRYQKRIR
jgi:hypothetical protein